MEVVKIIIEKSFSCQWLQQSCLDIQ